VTRARASEGDARAAAVAAEAKTGPVVRSQGCHDRQHYYAAAEAAEAKSDVIVRAPRGRRGRRAVWSF